MCLQPLPGVDLAELRGEPAPVPVLGNRDYHRISLVLV
jgi:hypothetical protein